MSGKPATCTPIGGFSVFFVLHAFGLASVVDKSSGILSTKERRERKGGAALRLAQGRWAGNS